MPPPRPQSSGGPTIRRMERASRREHLEGLMEELREQRKVNVDQVLMELVHFVFELDERKRNSSQRQGAEIA